MQLSDSFYNNFPVLPSTRRIRVLVIEPSQRWSRIEATIKLIDLDHPTPYATLSYTWGGQSKTEPILVEGHEICITHNLFNALQHLRSSTQALTIWADAVCINQADNSERSSQVAMMDDIYRRCEIVHIWLGCPVQPTPFRHSPFDLVKHFRDDKHYFDFPGYWWDNNSSSWRCDTQDTEFCSMTDAFLGLYNSAWWGRAWTAQEAILPKHATFRFGDWTMPLEDFSASGTNRGRHLGSPCCVVSYQAIGGAPGPRAEFDHILGAIECVSSLQTADGPYKSLLDVYRRFADRQCLDPRDKIYSLIGSLGPSMPRILVDYARPVGEIYLEAFASMIKEKGGCPSTLMGEGYNSGKFGLPSWVPDFSGSYGAPKHVLRRVLDAFPLFNASGSRSGKIEVVDHKLLRVSGRCIDKVKVKSRLIGGAWAPNLGEILEDWRQTCQQHGINISTTSRDLPFSLLLTGEMTEDLITFKYRLLKEDDPDLPTDPQWEKYMGPTADSSTLPRGYRITVGSMVDRKVLFVTASGRIGLSWAGVRPGDEVWILDGSNVPFLLREATAHNGCSNQRLLVGDAYVYGVMHGEGIDDLVTSEPVLLA